MVKLLQSPATLLIAEMDCGAVGTVLITIGHSSTEKINFWWNLRITSCWWLGTSEKVRGFHGLVKLLQSPATLLIAEMDCGAVGTGLIIIHT